jgi:hypothetical protein
MNLIIRELQNSDNIERRNELLNLKKEFEEVSIWLNCAGKS